MAFFRVCHILIMKLNHRMSGALPYGFPTPIDGDAKKTYHWWHGKSWRKFIEVTGCHWSCTSMRTSFTLWSKTSTKPISRQYYSWCQALVTRYLSCYFTKYYFDSSVMLKRHRQIYKDHIFFVFVNTVTNRTQRFARYAWKVNNTVYALYV